MLLIVIACLDSAEGLIWGTGQVLIQDGFFTIRKSDAFLSD